MPMTILNMNQVNSIISEHFIKIFGNVIEHYPPAAIGILKNRPFRQASDISYAFNNYLDKLNINEKHNVLEFYPDMVAKLADVSKIMLNIEFQKVSGADRLTFEDKQKIGQLNNHYREKFGFPFILYEKENEDVFTILSAMEERLDNEMEQEIEIAIEEIKKIAELRIHEILH